MLAAQLEDRFRKAIGATAGVDPMQDESVRFAVHFARLLSGILTERDLTLNTRQGMRRALEARTILRGSHIDKLIELALAPESRVSIDEHDLRAFRSRFGVAEEGALRRELTEEVDLRTFAQRYGGAESLLLLDSLFRVCAVDGRIDRTEIGRLVRAAEQLEVDDMLVGALFRMHDPRHNVGQLEIELDKERYVIGRAIHLELPLPDPQVAPRHAELFHADEGWFVTDLQSGRPTLVNGRPIQRSRLTPGDQLRIGSYVLTLGAKERSLVIAGARSVSALSIRGLTRHVGPKQLLADIDFTVFSGELIAVAGPSGSGKTTLLKAISGLAPADEGEVILDGESFHRVLDENRALMGMVPQDDVVHADLTVREALRYAGRLRMPKGTSRAQLNNEVNRVLEELDLESAEHSRIGDALKPVISGGQRKRVNLGQELLTRSTRILFLDEPTSGLDPQTAQDIIRQVRQLADDGRIVFVVTHDVTPSIMSMVDHLLVMGNGGHLAWFGPPAAAIDFFGVSSTDQIFSKMAERTAPAWAQAYRDSASFRKFVRTREHLLGLDEVAIEGTAQERIRHSRTRLFTLTERYAKIKLRDIGGLAVLMAQAPVLGLLMWLVFPAPDPAAMFVLALSCLWFGASASVRELIAERAIWIREARIGVSAVGYLASKVLVLGTLTAIQCSVLATLCFFGLEMGGAYGYSLELLAGICSLTGFTGMSIGLAISAHMESSEGAVGALPLVLIPQITFGGLIVTVKQMGPVAWVLSHLTVLRYAFEAVIKTGTRLADAPDQDTASGLSWILFNLGFRTSEDPELGMLTLPYLALIMGAFSLLLLALTARRVARTGRRG